MYKVYYNRWENVEEENVSLSSSFWTDKESEEERGEHCVKDQESTNREAEINLQPDEYGKAERRRQSYVEEHNKKKNDDKEKYLHGENDQSRKTSRTEMGGTMFTK